jgi:hypothetical protein
MNERMKELSNIAYMNHMERNPHSSFGRRYDYDTEFAELILKETISVLQKRFMGDLNREDMEVRRCIADVKKHFGVE